MCWQKKDALKIYGLDFSIYFLSCIKYKHYWVLVARFIFMILNGKMKYTRVLSNSFFLCFKSLLTTFTILLTRQVQYLYLHDTLSKVELKKTNTFLTYIKTCLPINLRHFQMFKNKFKLILNIFWTEKIGEEFTNMRC